MLAYDPEERISARRVLKHPFFKPLADLEKNEQNKYVLSTMRPKFNAGDKGYSSKNMDDTTVTDQINLSDYSSPNKKPKKPAHQDISKMFLYL